MKQPIKMTPGDELHLTALMAPFSLNLVTGTDRQHLLGYGRAAFDAGKDSAGKCLHQIQEPAADAPVVLPVLYVSAKQLPKHRDPDEAMHGRYIPARKTPAGNFTMPLYASLAGVSAPAAQAVPDGWTLVPVDLMPEMKREFMDLLMDGIDIYVNRRDQIEIQTDAPHRIWKAVLALSPAAPQAQADTRDALPEIKDMQNSPQNLNLNDRAFWVLGWNECRDSVRDAQSAAQAAQQGGEA